MQSNWPVCLNFVLLQEGGFENDPSDPGVWTGNVVGSGYQIGSNFGISAATLAGFYPSLSMPDLNNLMQTLTSGQAGSIYSSEYWQGIQGDSLPSGIDLMLFDDAVNKGIFAAVKTIQYCVNTDQDGDLGPMTLSAIQNSNIPSLALKLGAQQGILYTQGGNWSQFGLGWSRRWGARMQASIDLITTDSVKFSTKENGPLYSQSLWEWSGWKTK